MKIGIGQAIPVVAVQPVDACAMRLQQRGEGVELQAQCRSVDGLGVVPVIRVGREDRAGSSHGNVAQGARIRGDAVSLHPHSLTGRRGRSCQAGLRGRPTGCSGQPCPGYPVRSRPPPSSSAGRSRHVGQRDLADCDPAGPSQTAGTGDTPARHAAPTDPSAACTVELSRPEGTAAGGPAAGEVAPGGSGARLLDRHLRLCARFSGRAAEQRPLPDVGIDQHHAADDERRAGQFQRA